MTAIGRIPDGRIPGGRMAGSRRPSPGIPPVVGPGGFRCELADDALTWTDAVYDMFGYEPHRRLDRREVVLQYRGQSREELELVRSEAIRTASPFTLDAEIESVSGERRWIRIAALPEVRHGRVTAIAGTKLDVTAERAALDDLRHLAFNDPVTGLANRAHFHWLFLDRPQGCPTLAGMEALVLFDMNGFKDINDNWGHPVGDACLAVFGQRLRGAFPGAMLVSRIGGDEFAVLLAGDARRGPASHRLRNALPHLFAPMAWDGRLLPIDAAVGMAEVPRDPRQPGRHAGEIDPARLYVEADDALYRSKFVARSGPGRLRLTR